MAGNGDETFVSIPKKTTLSTPYGINSNQPIGPIRYGSGDTTITNEWVIYEACTIGNLPECEYSLYLKDAVIKESIVKLSSAQSAEIIKFAQKHYNFPFAATSLSKAEHYHWIKDNVEYFLHIEKKEATLKASVI
jgi:hypothetical protein